MKDYTSLEEKKLKEYVVICFDNVPRTVDGISIMPWRMFLGKLWAGVEGGKC